MKSNFTPVSVVNPSWMTPDFNPQIADRKFRAQTVVPLVDLISLLRDLYTK